MSASNKRSEICLRFSSSAASPLAYIGNKSVSSGQFHFDVERLLAQFSDRGDTLLTCPGRYGFSVALLASWLAGRTVILPPNQLEGTLKDIRSRFNITFECDASWAEKQQAPNRLPAHGTWEVSFPADLIAVKLFTSGSTGTPKTVAKSVANLMAEAKAIYDQFDWPIKPVVASVPANHLYGLTFSLLLPWIMDAPWIDETPVFAQDIFHTIRTTEAGILISIPDQYKALLEEPADCPDLMCLSAAASLPHETAKRWQNRYAREILEIYGSTETGVIGHRHQLTDESWIAFPQVRLSDKGGTLKVQSPFVGIESKGGYQTADLVTLLEDKKFHLIGRADSMVKIAGKRVSLTGIENSLLSYPGVTDAAVICVGVDGIIRDKAIWAIVAASGDHGVSTLKLKTFLRKRLDGVGVPRRILIVDKLPRNPNGKLPRKVLEDMFRVVEKKIFEFQHITLSRSGDSLSANCRLDRDAPFFQGHFPGQPIMPAASQIQMVEALMREHSGWNSNIRGGKSIKFIQRILPCDHIELQLTRDGGEGIRFSLNKDGAAATQGLLLVTGERCD